MQWDLEIITQQELLKARDSRVLALEVQAVVGNNVYNYLQDTL